MLKERELENKEVQIFEDVPEGWIKIENTNTEPRGYSWYSNGKSLFGGEYEHGLVKNKE